MNSAPHHSEAALQFALRKSIRKTVTPRQDFRCPGRFATAPAPLPAITHRPCRRRLQATSGRI